MTDREKGPSPPKNTAAKEGSPARGRSPLPLLLTAAAILAVLWFALRPPSRSGTELPPPSLEDAAASNAPSSAHPAPQSSSGAAGRSCLGMMPPQKRTLMKPAFTLVASDDLEEKPAASGFELSDKKGLSVMIEEIPYPATVGSSLDSLVTYVVDNVRTTTEQLLSKTTLEPTRWDRGSDIIVACYRGLTQGQPPSAVFFSVTGKKTSDGGFRLVTLSLDSAGSTDLQTVDARGGALLAGLVVSDEPIRSRNAPGRSIVILSEAAARQLRTMLSKDDVVWITVERGGSPGGPPSLTHRIGARSKNELPQESEITRVLSREIPIVIESKSVPLITGTTIEWVEGQGFRFDNPNMPPKGASSR